VGNLSSFVFLSVGFSVEKKQMCLNMGLAFQLAGNGLGYE